MLAVAQNKPTKYIHPEGKYYTINGAKIWAETIGKGDPIFFIAGGPGGAHTGLHSFDSLATNNQLVYFDGLGRGKSELAKKSSEYTIDRDVEDLEGLRKAMGFDEINILGHSYGSVVGQAYAIKYPNNIKHLIVANGFHSFLMWQANDDNSNHEIKTNYPEVWDTLMILRSQGYVSSDQICQNIYSRVPYGFLYSYSPDNMRKGPRDPEYPNPFSSVVYYQLRFQKRSR